MKKNQEKCGDILKLRHLEELKLYHWFIAFINLKTFELVLFYLFRGKFPYRYILKSVGLFRCEVMILCWLFKINFVLVNLITAGKYWAILKLRKCQEWKVIS